MKNIILSLLFTPLFAFAQDKAVIPEFVKDSLDNYVNNALKQWNIPGVAVCIIKDGKVIVMKGYGVTEVNGTEKVDENTLFNIGSNTKAFTGTLVAMLDAEKKLSLDDKATKWLPEFKMKDDCTTKEVTVRDLLCHRLGMKNDQGDFLFWDTDLNSYDVLKKFSYLTPAYSFRSKWGYTNVAFLAAGLIAGNAAHSTWQDLVRTKLFEPLGMTRTLALSKEMINATNKAAAHTMENNHLVKIPYIRLDNMGPAGAISSSVHDLSKWVLMQLDTGKLDGKIIVPASAIEQTWIPNSIMGFGKLILDSGPPLTSLYGLGFVIQEYDHKRIISHNGGVNGFVSSVMLVPEENLGIIVLTNTDANAFYEVLKWQVLDAYFGLPYKNYSRLFADFIDHQKNPEREMLAKKRDTVAMHLPAELPLQKFIGEYINDFYGSLQIEKEGAHLSVKFQHHTMKGKLEPLGGNRFLCTYSNPVWGITEIPFTLENNEVKSVTIRIAGLVDDLDPYEFRKK